MDDGDDDFEEKLEDEDIDEDDDGLLDEDERELQRVTNAIFVTLRDKIEEDVPLRGVVTGVKIHMSYDPGTFTVVDVNGKQWSVEISEL